VSVFNFLLKPFVKFLPENNRLERIWKLAEVDFKKRYYNDRFGLAWALINPLFRILVYYFVFKFMMDVQIENYALFLFAGLVLWMTFSEVTSRGVHVIRNKRYLIENIQFNHLDLFVSHTLSVFMGFGFTLVVYLLTVVAFGLPINFNVLYLFIIIINLILFSYGASLILATMNIFFNDIHHAWEMLLLLGFWTSGIFFDFRDFPESVAYAMYVHPFVGLVINMREVTMYGRPPDMLLLSINLMTGFLLVSIGQIVFNRYSYRAIERL
jgi:ABC-type polysaccharide/polyol phosphate export permease